MYLCVLRVRHVSPHGAPYTRKHIVPVRTTLHAAVLQCGATPPQGAIASLSMGVSMPEIVYTDGGACNPVQVKKEKKGWVAKLLSRGTPEKFGNVDTGVGAVIEDWDEN